MSDALEPPVRLPEVPPLSDADWEDAREALAVHATHRAGCPAKASPAATCNCAVGRWIGAIQP